MPNIKSAGKRVHTNARENLENRMVRSALKTQIKELRKAVESKSKDAETVFRSTVSAIDKAVSKGVLHKNNANRKKANAAKLMASSK